MSTNRNKEFIQLTKSGKDFIRSKCSGSGNSLLRGKNSYVLPKANPPVNPSKIYISNSIDHSGKPLITNEQLGESLIVWYNKYGKIYGLDANVLAVQTLHESGFKVWNYSKTGALGLTQFIPGTIYNIIISNGFLNGGIKTEPFFTETEANKLTNNIDGNIRTSSTYISSNNRENLHQNVIDNPELMIKAQFRYMKFIANRCDNITSSTLFGYNRGHGLSVPSYAKSVSNAIKYRKDWEIEGINYVYRIFKTLFNDFGYKHLNMSDNDEFNEFKAIIDDGVLRGYN